MDIKPNSKYNQEVSDIRKYEKEVEKALKCGIMHGIICFDDWKKRNALDKRDR